MDFKIMSCPVCGAPLHVGNDSEYIICDACDTPLRLNEEHHLFRADDAEAFGYHFEKGRQRAQSEREHRRQTEEYGSYYSSDYRSQPRRQMPPYQAPPTNTWDNRAYIDPMVSDKDRWTALVICIFLGMYGGHYFYLGNIKKGLLYFFTLGFLCFGWIIDIISLATGSFKDQYGRVLVSSKERYYMNSGNPYAGNAPYPYSGPGRNTNAYSRPQLDPQEEKDRKNARNRKIFLALTIMGIFASVGCLSDGDASSLPLMLVWTIVFGILWLRTPKPRS